MSFTSGARAQVRWWLPNTRSGRGVFRLPRSVTVFRDLRNGEINLALSKIMKICGMEDSPPLQNASLYALALKK